MSEKVVIPKTPFTYMPDVPMGKGLFPKGGAKRKSDYRGFFPVLYEESGTAEVATIEIRFILKRSEELSAGDEEKEWYFSNIDLDKKSMLNIKEKSEDLKTVYGCMNSWNNLFKSLNIMVAVDFLNSKSFSGNSFFVHFWLFYVGFTG